MKLAEPSVYYACSKGMLLHDFYDTYKLCICPSAALNSCQGSENLWISVFLPLPVLLSGLRPLSENSMFVHVHSFVMIVLGPQGWHVSGAFAGARPSTGLVHLTYKAASLPFTWQDESCLIACLGLFRWGASRMVAEDKGRPSFSQSSKLRTSLPLFPGKELWAVPGVALIRLIAIWPPCS